MVREIMARQEFHQVAEEVSTVDPQLTKMVLPHHHQEVATSLTGATEDASEAQDMVLLVMATDHLKAKVAMAYPISLALEGQEIEVNGVPGGYQGIHTYQVTKAGEIAKRDAHETQTSVMEKTVVVQGTLVTPGKDIPMIGLIEAGVLGVETDQATRGTLEETGETTERAQGALTVVTGIVTAIATSTDARSTLTSVA